MPAAHSPNPIDLHTHSTASDGQLSPSGLIRHAAEKGIRLLALTDHDTTDGLAEARNQAGGEDGPRLIAGVEISTNWFGHSIHVVGLDFDPAHPDLRRGLSEQARRRESRAIGIAERLEKHGVKNAYQGARAFAGDGPLGRAHFARYLVQQGFAGDERKVFKRYLIRGKPGYVANQWPRLPEAVEWITRAGGIAVVAHPARYKLTRTKLRELLLAFREAGGRGLEVVSGSHHAGDNQQMAGLARQFGFLASVGSDYHGPRYFWLEMGRLPPLPPGCAAIWEAFQE